MKKTISTAVIMFLGMIALTGCTQQTSQPIADIVSPQVETTGQVIRDTYQNNDYGFIFDYPGMLLVRDGAQDYKPDQLLNFYQLCSEIITTPQEPSLGANDNFVGYCQGGVFRIEIWDSATEISQIQTDFSTLMLTETKTVTIANTPASEYVYVGESMATPGTHTWHLFVVEGNGFIYAMRGEYCMDESIDICKQIISTLQFTKVSK